MPHDKNGQLIEIGDFIKTTPYNQHGPRPVVGRVAELKEEAACSGKVVWPAIGELKADYFGAAESELVLKCDGTDPA